MKKVKFLILATAISFVTLALHAQDKTRIMNDSKEAKAAFIKADPGLEKKFMEAYGYAILPNVGKGGVIVGGAGGNGTVYTKGKAIGTVNMVQASVGAQIGGQAFREAIFFETKEALDRFKDNKFQFSSQLSALAVKTGVSANMQYTEGVAVLTESKGGLMAEATVSGQKFTYKSLN